MKTYLGIAIAASALLAAPAFACEGARAEKMAEARDASFAEADADADGVLTAEEFVVFESAMRRAKRAQHFDRVDADGDGVVTAEELENARPPHRRRPPL